MQKVVSFWLAVVMLHNPFHRNWRAVWWPEFEAEWNVYAALGFGLAGLLAMAGGLGLAVRGAL